MCYTELVGKNWQLVVNQRMYCVLYSITIAYDASSNFSHIHTLTIGDATEFIESRVNGP